MMAENTTKWLVLELRDVNTYKVDYFTIDLDEKKLFKQDLSIEDSWWTGIVAFQDNKLILHKFQNSDSPEKKSFYLLDILTKKICWQSKNVIFSGILKNEIYGYEDLEDENRIYKKIWLKDFSENVVGQKEFDKKIREIAEAEEKNKDIAYPFYYPESHAYFEVVALFLKQFLHIHPVKGCDYLEQQNAVVISYYIYEEKLLTNCLLVINHQQEVLLHEKIGSRLEGIGTDTFFIVKNALIFIKKKHQLISYALDSVQ